MLEIICYLFKFCLCFYHFSGSSNEALFSNLPPCLHAELCLELTGDVMKNVPLFQGCELPFIRQLCTKAELIQFHKGELITCKGDIGHEMYFIKRGKVGIVLDSLLSYSVDVSGTFHPFFLLVNFSELRVIF